MNLTGFIWCVQSVQLGVEFGVLLPGHRSQRPLERGSSVTAVLGLLGENLQDSFVREGLRFRH
jgi:hypothetical protein